MLTTQTNDGSMRALFLTGWLLLLAAFAAAAAETIARTLPGGRGIFLSAGELWQALWPGAYMISEVRLSLMAPWLWDPVFTALLSPPAWFLFGVPGVILAWTCRPGRVLTADEEEELEEHEASLFLYDDLAREARLWAREEGDDPRTDDRLPNQDVVDLFERVPEDDDDLVIEPLPEFVKPRGE